MASLDSPPAQHLPNTVHVGARGYGYVRTTEPDAETLEGLLHGRIAAVVVPGAVPSGVATTLARVLLETGAVHGDGVPRSGSSSRARVRSLRGTGALMRDVGPAGTGTATSLLMNTLAGIVPNAPCAASARESHAPWHSVVSHGWRPRLLHADAAPPAAAQPVDNVSDTLRLDLVLRVDRAREINIFGRRWTPADEALRRPDGTYSPWEFVCGVPFVRLRPADGELIITHTADFREVRAPREGDASVLLTAHSIPEYVRPHRSLT